MKLKNFPELYAFLSNHFLDSDPSADEEVTLKFTTVSSRELQQQVITQLKQLLANSNFPIEELGTEANRWFGDIEEARSWIRQLLNILEGAQGEETVVVKDSNGTVLNEGDSVSVIKDLKVKGGSSDLKRGTLIKKIHLVNDPEVVECRVDGSTLVLKTCFLKKA